MPITIIHLLSCLSIYFYLFFDSLKVCKPSYGICNVENGEDKTATLSVSTTDWQKTGTKEMQRKEWVKKDNSDFKILFEREVCPQTNCFHT